MTKILLFSDTHGDLDSINRLTQHHNPDFCLHMGDFCCYTDSSVKAFTDDVLIKQVKHSSLPSDQISALCERNNREELEDIATRYQTYGNFSDYLTGKKYFEVPVYAVWGNNEDQQVIEQLYRAPIRNLKFLDADFQLFHDDFCFYGLGGELTSSKEPESGASCYMRTPASCFEKLVHKMDSVDSNFRRIQLTHIPGHEEDFFKRLAFRCGADLALSGHTHHWDEREIDLSQNNAGMDSPFLSINKADVHGFKSLTLPTVRRGCAILYLDQKQWNYRIF